MIASFVITFRETLEASLIVGILLSYLSKTNQSYCKKYVWQGVLIGIIFSGVLAFLLDSFFKKLPGGKTEELFEAVLMLATAAFLTWMILWIHRQKLVIKHLHEKVQKHIDTKFGIGIVVLTALSLAREGSETVLYLQASRLSGATNIVLGGSLGILCAVFLGYFLFRFSLKYHLNTILQSTSILLLLFAAGLVSHGVHEFQEAHIIPVFSFDPIVNISHILENNSTLGSILRSLFGYTSKPTIFEILSYGSYILFIYWIEKVTDRLIKSKP